jgi:glycosyltransferase involved in cell wall biosynthesis
MNVSVVVAVYNAAKTLDRCLAAVRAQTHEPVEVIVVDDASRDGSALIARRAGCTVLAHDVNRGVSAARNTGAAAARGEVLFFLDSDVALASDAIEHAVRLLDEDPGCGCVFGVYADEPLIDDGPIERYRILHLHFALTRAVGLTDTAMFALAAVPRRVFTDVGKFDERLRSAEDDDYSERLRSGYRIRLSATVRGHHDDVDRLLPALWEQYRRAQLIPFAARNRMRRDALKLNSTTGIAAAALLVATVPLGLFDPAWLALPVGLLVVFAVADPPLVAFVVRRKGLLFFGYFTLVHLLVHLAMLAGCARGLLRMLTDADFGPTRRRHDRQIGVTP